MSWRPEGWVYGSYPPPEDTFGSESMAFEAGADAMFEALRKMGSDPKGILGLTQLFQLTRCPMGSHYGTHC